jgi:hypothetical protein
MANKENINTLRPSGSNSSSNNNNNSNEIILEDKK